MSSSVIIAEAVTKQFTTGLWGRRSILAVSRLTFEVKRGEIFAFLGPNGAGKTTTINLLMGFLRPTSGRVIVLGLPAGAVAARQRMGYLPENYAFYSFFTAPALLNYFGRLYQIPRAQRWQRIERLLRALDLWRVRDLAVGKYSRGMRQRLGLAQALLNEPELLILDEPTSGFDPQGRKMVRDLLVERKAQGATIFLSSHILSEVEMICDSVAIVDRGQLLACGPLSEIIGTHRGYEITFTAVSNHTLHEIQALGVSVQPMAELLQAVVGEERTAQRVVDLIRSDGGVLKSYSPISRTLEDVFLELTGSREEASVRSVKSTTGGNHR